MGSKDTRLCIAKWLLHDQSQLSLNLGLWSLEDQRSKPPQNPERTKTSLVHFQHSLELVFLTDRQTGKKHPDLNIVSYRHLVVIMRKDKDET